MAEMPRRDAPAAPSLGQRRIQPGQVEFPGTVSSEVRSAGNGLGAQLDTAARNRLKL